MISIKSQLKKKGLRFKNSIEEYTDHFSCLYEDFEKIHRPEKATIYTTVAINRLDVKQINKDYFKLYYKNKVIMTSLATSLIIIFFGFISVFSDPPSIPPIDQATDHISSNFGMRIHPINKQRKKHTGIDIKAEIGDKVMSTADGIVVKADFDKKHGYFIEIKHDDTYSTRYHHLSKLNVQVNDKVEKGQKIGEVGSTGLSTAPHLHYEVIENGKKIDPRPFFQA